MEGTRFEAFDEYIRLQQASNDHHMRAVLAFDARLDPDILRRAVRRSFDLAPVIGCAFLEKRGRPQWERRTGAFSDEESLALRECELSDEVFLPIIAQTLDASRGPQLRVVLLRGATSDALMVIANHMAFDGTGLKSYLALLADLYTREAAGDERALDAFPLERRASVLLREIRFTEKLSAALWKNGKKPAERPFLESDGQARIILRKLRIGLDELGRISTGCAARKATINDFILAAFYQALFSSRPYREGEGLSMNFMIDMRRYDRARAMSPFSNLSSMETLYLPHSERGLDDTLNAVADKTRALKSKNPGLKNFISLTAAYACLPRRLFDSILSKVIGGMGVSTSNLGILDPAKLSFAGAAPADACLLTSVKRQPGLQLSFSTYRGELSLSVLGAYSEENTRRIEAMFSALERIMKDFPGRPRAQERTC
jgi:NRPS condensation-like uncharacterized protein